MKIWIDTQSGTWGQDDGTLVLVEVTQEEIEELDHMSDSDIADLGLKKGQRPWTR